MSPPLLSLLLPALLLLLALRRWRRVPHPLPPGPKPLPFIGNLLDLPKSYPWIGYQEMCKRYGDVVFLQIPMQSLLIVGSAQAATDLLDKRSHLYSDRLYLRMMDLIGWGFSMAIMPYAATWKAYRRRFHEYFNPGEIHAYRNTQAEEIHFCLYRLLESPHNVRDHLRLLSVTTVLRIVYGMRIKDLNDEYLLVAKRALDGANQAGLPGVNMVEYLPFLQHIPSWLPGGHTQRMVKEFRPVLDAMLNLPWKAVKQTASDGVDIPSVASSMLAKAQEQYGYGALPTEEEKTLKAVTAVMFVGGADTTLSAATTLLLAMAMFPKVQRKAQAEIDRVVGPDRMPDFKDIESLAYVRAIALETLRWVPAGPFAIPHRLMEDDWYRGYFIPKGTLVIPNSWAMLMDPSDYPEPHIFNPERFIKDGKINPDVRNPNEFAFGYGRRICPGQDLANASLNLFVASVFHVFNIEAGFEEDGTPISLSAEASDGFVSHPLKIPHGIKPRSEAAERLIRDCNDPF